MDDRTFDEPSARAWIETIEAAKTSPRDHDIYPRLNTWIQRTQPASLLEIGAGQGVCSDKIDLANRHYTGVEPSPFLLDRANERYAHDNRRFTVGSAYALPADDAAFDAAFSVAVWHLLADLEAAARELSRVLKPGGSFLIITANPGNYSAWTERYAESRQEGRRFEGRTPDDVDVLYLHTLEEITGSLEAAGVSIRTIETFREDVFVAIEGLGSPPC